MKHSVIITSDPFQPDYSYELVEPAGNSFDAQFKPELTPQQMLKLGVFGGAYFEGYTDEYPSAWFDGVKQTIKPNPKLNYYGVSASQPLQVWQQKGWIYPEDPRGWFQWYCRYYLGRRIVGEDARQIKRWRAFVRHRGQIKAYCEPGDDSCRPRQRQALLHWAYDSRRV